MKFFDRIPGTNTWVEWSFEDIDETFTQGAILAIVIAVVGFGILWCLCSLLNWLFF